MKKLAHRRHDISQKTWGLLEPHLPGSSGSVGRPASDNRLFINAVFWVIRTGASWRDLPPDTPKMPLHSSPLSKYVASIYGQK